MRGEVSAASNIKKRPGGSACSDLLDHRLHEHWDAQCGEREIETPAEAPAARAEAEGRVAHLREAPLARAVDDSFRRAMQPEWRERAAGVSVVLQ